MEQTGHRSLLIALVLALPDIATAAPLSIGESEVTFQELTLEADQELGGRSATFAGETSGEASFFFVPGIDVMSPTVVTILAQDPAQPVGVSLHRHYWNEPDLEGETSFDGSWTFTGRIDDSVGISIKAEQPTGFVLLFWSGDAAPPQVPPILFDGGKAIKPGTGQE